MPNHETYYCPLSARLLEKHTLDRFAADGVVPELWSDSDHEALKKKAHEFAQNRRLSQQIQPDGESSDACFAAFCMNNSEYEDHRILVSRDPWNDDDELSEIWQGLAPALRNRDITGLWDASVDEQGYFVVHLDYVPSSAPSDTTIRQQELKSLFKRLDCLHKRGLIHGGINERWINPSLKGQEVFGCGLARFYSLWRRKNQKGLGLLVGDPRFASPAELEGHEPSAESDRRSLVSVAATMMSMGLGKQQSSPAWKRPVLGPDAIMQRIVLTPDDWVKGVGDSKEKKILLKRLSDTSEGPESSRGTTASHRPRKMRVDDRWLLKLLVAANLLVLTLLVVMIWRIPGDQGAWVQLVISPQVDTPDSGVSREPKHKPSSPAADAAVPDLPCPVPADKTFRNMAQLVQWCVNKLCNSKIKEDGEISRDGQLRTALDECTAEEKNLQHDLANIRDKMPKMRELNRRGKKKARLCCQWPGLQGGTIAMTSEWLQTCQVIESDTCPPTEGGQGGGK